MDTANNKRLRQGKRVISVKIPGDIPRIPGVYNKQGSTGKISRVSAASSKKDVVSISNQAKDYQTVMKALRDIPDIRQNKINDLLERYQSGNYDVSGKDIADKIVRSIMDKKA